MRKALLITHQAEYLPALTGGLEAAGWAHGLVDSVEAVTEAGVADPPARAVFIDKSQVDGAEVVVQLRRLHPGCEVVLLGTSPLHEQLDLILRLDVFDHLVLPFAPDRLALLLRSLEAKVTLQDERRRLEAEVTRLTRHQDLLSRAAMDGQWELSFATSTLTLSPRWKMLLGYAENELTDNLAEWLDRVHPEDRDQVREEIVVHRDGLTEYFTSEHRLRHKSGEYRWVLSRGLAERDATGRALRMVGSQADITAQRLAEERLLHESYHDPLTGLPNGAQLRERLDRARLHAERRPAYTYAVLFLDIDRFKNVNDSLGHLEGDQLLMAIAGRLKSCVRPTDVVARLGGDEFTILLDGISDRADARRAAERVQRALAAPIRINGQELYVSASIGIAISADGKSQPRQLVRDADAAMYHAKARGGGSYAVFDDAMHSKATHMLGIESNLRRALAKQELRLYYQPIISFATGQVAGFEALLRWYSPERGIIPPNEFIPVAEETGLIVPIGRWVLQEACRQMKAWSSIAVGDQPLFMSVNISPRQFTQPDLVDQIGTVLSDTGVDPKTLKLEVTESLLIDNVESTAQMMKKLQGMNLRLCIDDFGTGYSSLSTLYQLPIHTLKVDRSFVSRLSPDGKNGEIVDTIIMLAHNLGMDVIAEGIENAHQLEQLKLRKCEYGQGYFFSRPVAADAAGTLLTAKPPWPASLIAAPTPVPATITA